MANALLLRFCLFFVRLVYFILPILKFIIQALFWGVIAIVSILLLFVIF